MRAARADGSISAVPDLAMRTLRSSERSAVLDLLDEWRLPDGWRGRDFFGRYIEHDPAYRDENFWVAERDGALVACVQIFPRALRIAGAAVRTGGIGSVFTSEKARGSGVSSALLEAAVAAMRERGMPLSLLFASRHAFYSRLGWQLWPRPRPLWLRGAATQAPDAARRVDAFEAARDLDAVIAIHERYSEALPGSVVRDRAYWEGQLRFAGSPEEDFLVARDASGDVEAYARGCLVDGMYFVTEIGRRESAVDAAADLVLRLSAPRDPDPLAARAGRASAELRRVAVAPPLDDPAFAKALAARGVDTKRFEERSAMLRLVDGAALARATGVARASDESDAAYLARLLPPERLVFWPSDRF
jgi:GNAT superfamily N-acetyltransferase